jgi:hypothetical protein
MPNARDLAELSLVIHSVHNAIRSKENLANVVTSIFRNDATEVWKFLQAIRLRNQFISEGHCALGLSRAMKMTIS